MPEPFLTQEYLPKKIKFWKVFPFIKIIIFFVFCQSLEPGQKYFLLKDMRIFSYIYRQGSKRPAGAAGKKRRRWRLKPPRRTAGPR
jgi:hypothetical protein